MRQKERLKEAGMCYDGCGRPAIEGSVRCHTCTVKNRERVAQRYKLKLEAKNGQ